MEKFELKEKNKVSREMCRNAASEDASNVRWGEGSKVAEALGHSRTGQGRQTQQGDRSRFQVKPCRG